VRTSYTGPYIVNLLGMQINQIDDRSICFNKLQGVVVTVVLRGSIQTTISVLVFEYLKYDDAMLIEQIPLKK
jgi:hypothetical protein